MVSSRRQYGHQQLTPSTATWDSPPGPSQAGYAAFEHAFQRFVDSRRLFVPKKDKKAARTFDNRSKSLFEQKQLALQTDPDLGQEGKLMDFQVNMSLNQRK